jgi:hypothetical protein
MKACRKTKSTSRKRPTAKPLPRRLVVQLLADLCERAQNQLSVLDAIAATNAPNEQHVVMDHRLRTVTGILLENQASSLRQISGFAQIIHARAAGLPIPPDHQLNR